jgi:flagellar hook-associated protein 2
MSTISSPTYDPASTAAALAQKYTAPMQDVLTNKTKDAAATQKGLSTLQSAIKAFQLSLTSMTGLNQTMFAQSATLSDTTIGTASATAKASPATYSFFVEKLATASQVAYTGLSDNGAASGSVDIMMGTSATPAVHVDLTGADTDGGGLSVRELAAAINKAAAGKLTATVITIPATAGDPSAVPPVPATPETKQLMLTSATTGFESKITLDTSGMGASGMTTDLQAAGNYKELVTAQDSVVWLGTQGTGTKVQQAANKLTAIDGVTVTLTKAQAAGAPPVTMTVGTDTDGTKKNVQAFITAYNTLKTAIDGLADAGDPENGVAAGVFAHDAGIRALRDQMVGLLRPSVLPGAPTLSAYGITAQKDGTLILDDPKLKPRLMKQLAVDSAGLDKLIGSTAASKRSGIADKLDTMLAKWSDITNGQIKQRGDAVTKLQKDLTNRQTQLDAQYDSAYQRYLLQFTKLQELQSQMTSNASMFEALFGNQSKN